MTPIDKPSWTAFLDQKSAWVRNPTAPFPAASKEISTAEVERMMREWDERGRGKSK